VPIGVARMLSRVYETCPAVRTSARVQVMIISRIRASTVRLSPSRVLATRSEADKSRSARRLNDGFSWASADGRFGQCSTRPSRPSGRAIRQVDGSRRVSNSYARPEGVAVGVPCRFRSDKEMNRARP